MTPAAPYSAGMSPYSFLNVTFGSAPRASNSRARSTDANTEKQTYSSGAQPFGPPGSFGSPSHPSPSTSRAHGSRAISGSAASSASARARRPEVAASTNSIYRRYDNGAMRAIQITEKGGPEVMQLRDVPEPAPGDGELLVAVEAVGVNYRDVYEREGRGAAYGKAPLPLIVGAEGAGTVLRGDGEFSAGDRVGWVRRRGATPSASWCRPRRPSRSRTAPRPNWPPPCSCRA